MTADPVVPLPDRQRRRIPDLPGVATYQELLDSEVRPVPDVLRLESSIDLGVESVDVERYVSRTVHTLEMERMWRRVWQVAAREDEVPEVGDSIVYEIGDASLIIVRSAPDELRAFHNSCLHRGRQLCTAGARLDKIRCPFHGFTWSLEGHLLSIPSQWDFPQVQEDEFSLPQAQVEVWDGWIFINLDTSAPALQEYLGEFVNHFSQWPTAGQVKQAHVLKHLRCNWKVALEAFLESYHTIATHPQLLVNLGDVNSEYDVYEGQPHFNRMITPQGIASPHLKSDIPDVAIIESLLGPGGGRGDTPARRYLADAVRADAPVLGGELLDCTDSEAIDAIQYFVFPNFVPWGGCAPIFYRFRPNGNDPDTSLMDVILLRDPGPETRLGPIAVTELDYEQPFSSVRGLGRLAGIFDQDMTNIAAIQRGLHASQTRRVTLSQYQESRIRHYLATLDWYLDLAPSSEVTP
jgi:nitrite reductase/ring-hydroxylating ferredoxin subunit